MHHFTWWQYMIEAIVIFAVLRGIRLGTRYLLRRRGSDE